ncbi:925_t:CDS:2, partial [Acaulospora morrowiae]
PFLKSINMNVESCNMLIEGRVLQPPVLEYHPKSVNHLFTPEAGRWNIANKVVVLGKNLQNWSVIVFSTERNCPKQVVRRFTQKFREVANQKGMDVSNEPEICYFNPVGDIRKSLYQACCTSRFNKDLPPQLIFCVLEHTGSLYGEIKRIGDTELGVPTQVVLTKLLSRRGIDQICANIALKVNVKLGGQNCFLSEGQLSFVSEVPTMIFGADVFHPGRGENKPSIAAVCGSVNRNATMYCGRYSKNEEPRNETIENLREMVDDLMRAFWERNATLPHRILFYRDGVSEGQFEHVLRVEVKALKETFCRCYKKGFEPKLTFVIVQKRHHTRFMPNEPRDGDKNANCPPGTVVDSTILVPQEFGFCKYHSDLRMIMLAIRILINGILFHIDLQPQNVLQGTGRPIHYSVLYDENKFTADEIQTLTHKLCYLSARCTLAISLVPPVHYAHLMAN